MLCHSRIFICSCAVLTAKTQEPDKNEAYDTGGDDFLSKPFEQSELVRKVKALIRRYNIYKEERITMTVFSESEQYRSIRINVL